MHKQSPFFLILILLFSCAENLTEVNTEYADIVIRGAVLEIESIKTSHINILCPDDLIDDFGDGDVNEMFINYFDDIFPYAIKKKSNLGGVIYNSGVNSLDSLVNQPHFTLIIDQMDIATGYTHSYQGGSTKYLEFGNVRYRIIDNIKNKESINGVTRVSKNGVLGIQVTSETWNELAFSLAHEIILNSPFYESGNFIYDQVINSETQDIVNYENSTNAELNIDDLTLLRKRNLFNSNIKFSISYNQNFHIRDKNTGDPNIPDEWEDLEEGPSVSNFYKNDSGFNLGFSYGFSNSFTTSSNDGFIIGLNYNQHNLISKDSDMEKIAGQNLSITRFTPFLGYTAELNKDSNWYCNIGYSFRHYFGSGSFYLDGQKINLNSYYDNVTSVFISLGAHIRISKKYPILLQPEVSIDDFGSVHLKDVRYDPGGTFHLETPLKLSDTFISLSIGMVYEFDGFTFFK